MEAPARFIYILLGLLVIVLYLLNKKTELSYLAVGYGVFSCLTHIVSLNSFSGLSIGFYLILLSSLIIGILTMVYNEKEADALINVDKPAVEDNDQIANQPILDDNINN